LWASSALAAPPIPAQAPPVPAVTSIPAASELPNAWRKGERNGDDERRCARGTEPSWVRSVRHFSEDGANPHLDGIFPPGANPTLLSSIQTAARMGPLRPGSLRSPTKHTVSLASPE